MTGDRSDARDGPRDGGTRAGGRTGAFGFVRLALAALVVIGHAPELLDGNRLREPLTRVFGTLSLGDAAVDGFFVVSGFLVTGSWLRSCDTGAYLMRRVVRIYPGFLVAFAVSLLVVGPLAGGSLARLGTAGLAAQSLGALSLLQPTLPGAFAGLPYPLIDGAMWTIELELGCYLLVIVLGKLGVLRRPWLLAALAAGCFALYRGLSIGAIAEPAMAVFGGFLILAASRTQSAWLRRLGERTDVSYGLYLYAWPIMNLTILWVPKMPPGPLALVTLTAAVACGWASWHVVEAPASRWMQRRLSMARERSTASESLLPA